MYGISSLTMQNLLFPVYKCSKQLTSYFNNLIMQYVIHVPRNITMKDSRQHFAIASQSALSSFSLIH